MDHAETLDCSNSIYEVQMAKCIMEEFYVEEGVMRMGLVSLKKGILNAFLYRVLHRTCKSEPTQCSGTLIFSMVMNGKTIYVHNSSNWQY